MEVEPIVTAERDNTATAEVRTRGRARRIVHRCVRCNTEFEHGYTPRCRSCDGLVEVTYDLAAVRLYDSPITAERFADLLPLVDRRNLLSLGEGQTPCLHAEALGDQLGLINLYLKVEARNPTGTTKDRMAAVVLSLFKELGLTEFISSSTGNSSSALARGLLLHRGFTMHLYVGGDFKERLRFTTDNAAVVVHVLDGLSFAAAFDRAKTEAKNGGLPFEAGFFNPARREGLKLAYFEAVEQLPVPIDWYVQAVSSAMGIYGAWKGARELLALGSIPSVPRMVCVQQETCNPMVRAFREGCAEILPRHVVPNPRGIAKAILRGNPTQCYPYVHEMVVSTNGTMVSVSEGEILKAQAQLRSAEGIDGGYCGAATVAAVAQLAGRGEIARDDVVLLNLTD